MTGPAETPEAFIAAHLRPDLVNQVSGLAAPDPDLPPDELLAVLVAHHGRGLTSMLRPQDAVVELDDQGPFLRSPDGASIEIDGESVVLDLGTGEAFGLNAVGTVLWNLLATPRTLDELAAAVTDRYAVPAEQALEDVARLLVTLRDRGLLGPQHSSGAGT